MASNNRQRIEFCQTGFLMLSCQNIPVAAFFFQSSCKIRIRLLRRHPLQHNAARFNRLSRMMTNSHKADVRQTAQVFACLAEGFQEERPALHVCKEESVYLLQIRQLQV